jgi:hypothetical protein
MHSQFEAAHMKSSSALVSAAAMAQQAHTNLQNIQQQQRQQQQQYSDSLASSSSTTTSQVQRCLSIRFLFLSKLMLPLQSTASSRSSSRPESSMSSLQVNMEVTFMSCDVPLQRSAYTD